MVNAQKIPAIHLYKSFGFVEAQTLHNQEMCDGEKYDLLVMEKKLEI